MHRSRPATSDAGTGSGSSRCARVATSTYRRLRRPTVAVATRRRQASRWTFCRGSSPRFQTFERRSAFLVMQTACRHTRPDSVGGLLVSIEAQYLRLLKGRQAMGKFEDVQSKEDFAAGPAVNGDIPDVGKATPGQFGRLREATREIMGRMESEGDGAIGS